MPDVQGGVETHAEQLYPRLAGLGCRVEVIVRTPFMPKKQRHFGPIRLTRIWSPRRPGVEVIVHSILGALYAGIVRPDVLHIHSIGPALVTPLARLLGIKVVVTYHSQNYEHEKWGTLARALLRSGENVGMRCSNARIAVSRNMAAMIRARYARDVDLIHNGVVPATPGSDTDELARFGLTPGAYVLQVGRVASEKRQLDLINAFARRAPPGWRLAVVGGLDGSPYAQQVQRAAAADARVVLTDFMSGRPLQQLYSHAAVFVLPSAHEGMPIALLEALSYGLPVLASDIPANRELDLPEESYFPVGDIDALGAALERCAREPHDTAANAARRERVTADYDWDRIAAQTLAVYRRISPGA